MVSRGTNTREFYDVETRPRSASDERQSSTGPLFRRHRAQVVVSLADYGDDYEGGLYLVGESSQRHYVRLDKGDAIVHQYDLHHGVKVHRGTRWSWILWFRDSTSCEDHSDQWHRECAIDGNPICHALYASKAPPSQHLDYQFAAARGGSTTAMTKHRAGVSRLQGRLPSRPAETRTRLPPERRLPSPPLHGVV